MIQATAKKQAKIDADHLIGGSGILFDWIEINVNHSILGFGISLVKAVEEKTSYVNNGWGEGVRQDKELGAFGCWIYSVHSHA